MNKYYTTPRERLILRICGIDETALKTSMVAVQCGLRGWNVAKQQASKVDPIVSALVASGIVLGGGAYSAGEYMVKFRASKQQARYGVTKWEFTSRECAVCMDVFDSVRLRTTKKRHHCFSCGHIVCHACSTTEMYLDVTGKIRRVCDECVLQGVPKKHIDPFAVKRSDMIQKVERKAEFNDKTRDSKGNVMSADDIAKADLAISTALSQAKSKQSLINPDVLRTLADNKARILKTGNAIAAAFDKASGNADIFSDDEEDEEAEELFLEPAIKKLAAKK